MGHYDHAEYVELTMHFRCNLRCEHCMIEGTMDRLHPESDEEFERLLDTNARERRWKGLILTGSEITLRSDLATLARQARERGGFQHVRIQTHGMRLSDRKYCGELVDAGIDEYFISITAADQATHDAITQVPGSFHKTLQALHNLDHFRSVETITNTVITRRSFQHLPSLVKLLGPLRNLVQMDFWSYFPMREVDDKQLLVSHLEVAPYLHAAILQAWSLGRAVEVKNFPECLLGELRGALDNGQPMLIIDPAFWNEFHRNGFYQCVHRENCASQTCLGLNTAYVDRFGWHADALRPLTAAWPSHAVRTPCPSPHLTTELNS